MDDKDPLSITVNIYGCTLLQNAIYVYFGQGGKHGLSLAWKLGLYPSTLAHLSSNISISQFTKRGKYGTKAGHGGNFHS